MILAIIQARMTSTRLPGKSLKMLGEKTILAQVITRVQRCKNVDGIVVATSIDDSDLEIVQEAVKYGALYYRGSLEDVMERYYKAAKLFKADTIVRITADCPYIMPDVVDRLIVESETYNYGSNIHNRTYPKGLDCEVFSFEELERAHTSVIVSPTTKEREHVTPYIKSHALNQYSLTDTENYSRKRLTVDYPFDLTDMEKFYPIIGDIYTYKELKKHLPSLIGTEEYSINIEFGRV